MKKITIIFLFLSLSVLNSKSHIANSNIQSARLENGLIGKMALNPVASFTVSVNPAACGQVITFDASGSYHEDPSHSIISYQWDFDAIDVNHFASEKSGQIVAHSYSNFGVYKAWLKVVDDIGNTAYTSITINVNQGNSNPVADAGGPYTAQINTTISLNGSNSTDPDESCGDFIDSYSWDIDLDGNYGDLIGSNPELEVKGPYFNAGNIYTIRLLVTDGFGATNIDEAQITVQAELPVELTSFAAEISDGKVLLTWTTATEIKNYGFDVERRIINPGEDSTGTLSINEWQKVGFVEGHGNSNLPNDYSFLDNSISINEFEYRLKQIDFDGNFEYSHKVKVDLSVSEGFSVKQNFPNPFNPTTKIEFSIPLENNVEIKVFNLLGMEVATLLNEGREAGTYSIEFNASNLSSGIYFYKIVSGNYSEFKKMILLK